MFGSACITCIAYGFVARVAAGPRFSPLGRFVTQVLTPALPFQEKLVPGPPKRFAQGIGATLSLGAAASFFIAGNTTVALVMIGMIAIAATLEAAIGFCLGCVIFRWLMDRGVIPETTCEACSNLDLRRPVMVP